MSRTIALSALLLALAVPAVAADPDPRTLLQLVDYVGVDYPEAVADGSVVNAGEYAEMQEFSGRIVELAGQLGAQREVADGARQLRALIRAKAPAADITAVTARLRDRIMAAHPVTLTPAAAPDLARAAALYEASCAACHGAGGYGDGPAAAGLEPAPTDFNDRARASQRSLYGLYNVITLGVEGTAMPSFAALADSERWALAFYVGGFAATDDELAAGAAALAAGVEPPDARTLTTSSPRQLADAAGQDVAMLAMYLRQHPSRVFAARPSPFAVAREKTELAALQFRQGNRAAAYTAALSAYLDGFELAESGLSAVDAALMRRVEADMFAMREAVKDPASALPEVEQRARSVLAGLDEAERALDETTLTPAVVFSSSLVILLREGLEAILILAAIAAFMIKTGRRDTLRYMHAGWLAALALGVATWAVSTWLLTIGGATREVTEGLTALFAAVMLFYVGFWMHNKLQAKRWNQFLHGQVGKVLEGGTLWTLTLVSFVAVYREVFETVLFYQALWAQTGDAGQGMLLGGAGTAAVLLVALTWGIFRLGIRLPLKQFFGVSAVVMIVLAVMFAGKGVAALQEAGSLPSDPIALLPRIELLGIYPNWQGIGLQLAMTAIAIGLVLRYRRAPALG